ncbi:hypothetical protein OHS33_35470 [Streptomyces sp. NBC_00536]|uniref:hypothetical protein n=1 Tax=Streptomyces sp. NBC_00536 TaxID=2975769 RepID=UPI002E81E234|nr:hypothetical protein [Streptomyces sp. NBC_00536]WUC84062.1 hypothetical protein OHS33_35470 [Streptomyces sp. NBC_00536]
MFADGADAQRAGVSLGPQLAELVPVGEAPQELLVFGVCGRCEAFGQPALEEQEPAVLAGQGAAFHEQVAQVGGGPPVRHLPGEGHVCPGPLPRMRHRPASARSRRSGPAALPGLRGHHPRHQFRKLRAKADAGPLSVSTVSEHRQQTTQADAFLTWLTHRGSTLATATQADLDAWHAENYATRRAAQPFLRWCMDTRRMPRLTIPYRTATNHNP